MVLVSVDQLRADLLEVYAPALSHGFARIAREGRVHTQASHRHASTSTAVGHTTLATGVVPTRHGIVGNEWWEWTPDGSLRTVYSVEDTLSPILGHPGEEGRSPRNLHVDALPDWIQAQDPGARVVSLSRKDRSAIPMGGKGQGHVYWIDDASGTFVTSTWYRDRYPDWIATFNAERMPALMGDPVWERVTPDSLTRLARADDAWYEGDGEHTTFPHLREEERPGDLPEAQYRWASRTPAPDQAVLELAALALEELGLGQRPEGTDYLALGFSQTDYVGHDYGPMSQEQLSNLIHLDRVLGDLLDLLDEEVGPGNWVLALSADHGVMDTPEWSAETGVESRRLSLEEIRALREVAARAAEEAASRGWEPSEAVATAVETEFPWVRNVYLPREVVGEPADSFAALFGRSHSDTRHVGSLARYGVHLQLQPGVLLRTERQGTTHGSPYWHDRHVPLILLGAGVEPGAVSGAAYTYQVAPTLAALAGVPTPMGLDGDPLPARNGRNP